MTHGSLPLELKTLFLRWSMKLVVVESPAKAKTINKYLGRDYEVLASYGHVRDLPAKEGSVDPDHDFAMTWAIEDKANKRVQDIAKAAEQAETIILATDPDREGEAISWHLMEILKSKKALKDKPFERVAFNAVTKETVTKALASPRRIDQALVDAYLARRALDYLVGFTLSPVLWRKLPSARSAGRVQSVALRLVANREDEIERFVKQEYWSLTANLTTAHNEPLTARLIERDGKKIGKHDIPNEAEAREHEIILKSGRYNVKTLETKPHRRNPAPPFTTSTLQQEASRKLGFAPARTMQLAQKLYEGVDIGGETVGLITYMRTDGVDMTPDAIAAVRRVLNEKFGEHYVPSSPRMYKTKAKNAQEAHEAIRPTDPRRTPQDLKRVLDGEMFALYELIWRRTLASQMAHAEIQRTVADIEVAAQGHTALVRANGSVITFNGFLALYEESFDDNDDEDSRRLPSLKEGAHLELTSVATDQHFTEPPPRYSEASLVKRMEELGIGRPSTYASTLSVLKDRGYVKLEKKRLVPESSGRLVTSFLEGFFGRYVEYSFTADLEEQLDRISSNDIDWKTVLRDFWSPFQETCKTTLDTRNTVILDQLTQSLEHYVFPPQADGTPTPRNCPTCTDGQLSLKIGRFGSFIGCSNYPECRYTRQLGTSQDDVPTSQHEELGQDPVSGHPIVLKSGRFGPYLEAGSGKEAKRQSLPRGIRTETLNAEKAAVIINLPRKVGTHPETGEDIMAGFGRFGPYLLHQGQYIKLESAEDVLTIGVNHAVDKIADHKDKPGAQRATAGTELGKHPKTGKSIWVKKGRFGPYLEHGTDRVTLKRDENPQDLTLEEIVERLDSKAKTGKSPAKSKKSPAKEGATKKVTKKKATPTKAKKAS